MRILLARTSYEKWGTYNQLASALRPDAKKNLGFILF